MVEWNALLFSSTARLKGLSISALLVSPYLLLFFKGYLLFFNGISVSILEYPLEYIVLLRIQCISMEI
jgi:hypothetical protein